MWQLGWWHRQAVQTAWQGRASLVFWHVQLAPTPQVFRQTWMVSSASSGVVCLCPHWPRLAPSEEAKLCTYFAGSLRPTQLRALPYFKVPLPILRLQLLMRFHMGSHALPAVVEQGRLARPAVPQHLCGCTLCSTRALQVSDERHLGVGCCPVLPARVCTNRQVWSLKRDAVIPCNVLCSTRTRRLPAVLSSHISWHRDRDPDGSRCQPRPAFILAMQPSQLATKCLLNGPVTFISLYMSS